jgi:hypothetical protein
MDLHFVTLALREGNFSSFKPADHVRREPAKVDSEITQMTPPGSIVGYIGDGPY